MEKIKCRYCDRDGEFIYFLDYDGKLKSDYSCKKHKLLFLNRLSVHESIKKLNRFLTSS